MGFFLKIFKYDCWIECPTVTRGKNFISYYYYKELKEMKIWIGKILIEIAKEGGSG